MEAKLLAIASSNHCDFMARTQLRTRSLEVAKRHGQVWLQNEEEGRHRHILNLRKSATKERNGNIINRDER